MTGAIWCGAAYYAILAYTLYRVVGLKRGGRLSRRKPEHDALISFALELLRDDKIVALMLEKGTTTPKALVALRATLMEMSYPLLQAVVARLLNDPIVRTFVARHMSALHGVDIKRFKAEMTTMVMEIRN